MNAAALALLAALSLGPAAQAQTNGGSVSTAAAKGPFLRLVPESELPDFRETFTSKKGLEKAARKTLAYLARGGGPKTIRIGDRDYGPAALEDSAKALLDLIATAVSDEEFADQVKKTFDVFQSVGNDGNGRVVFSSYYQPILSASLKKSPQYPVPLYRRPPDMVEADLSAFDKKYEGDSLLGRVDKSRRFVPYFTRGDIDIKRSLAGKGLELAWLKTKWEALDIHIQGSGILKFPSGKMLLAKYAATNARPYNSVGLLLVKANIFSREEISGEKVREYLRSNPQAEDWILAQNPRYTFFELAPLPEDGEPFGTVQQSLVPARSIAIDPAIIPLGALAYFTTTSPQSDQKGRVLGQFPNSRFALCMDTGGAIKGPGRVDIYAGHGEQAAATAKGQWADGKLYILVKKLPPRER